MMAAGIGSSGNSDYYDRAWKLINTIKNTEYKNDTIKQTLQMWKDSDPAGFEKWSTMSLKSNRVEEKIFK